MKKIQVYYTEDQLSKIDEWAIANGMNRGQAIRYLSLKQLQGGEEK